MAISKNLYTRGLKQRLAGAVWYQQKGRTLVRELAASVSNPQTEDQMDNRVKMSNCVAIYRANAEWMKKYAFETKKNYWSVYNAFMSANLSANDVMLAKSDVEVGAAVAAPYIMTRGSLSSVACQWDAAEGAFVTDLWTGNLSFSQVEGNSVTVGTLSTALLANNNGLQEGDQLSFIWNIQNMDANGIPSVIARYCELIINTSDDATLADRVGSGIIAATSVLSGGNSLSFLPQSGVSVQAALICVSRDNGSSVLVSTQQFVLTDDSIINTFKGSAARQRAIRSYAAAVESPFLSGGYQTETQEVAVSPAITGVSIGTGAYVTGGNYLGNIAANAVLHVRFNTLPEGTIAYVSVLGSDPDVQLTTVTTSDNIITGTMPSSQYDVMAVEVSIDGVLYTIRFLDEDPGVTE